MQLRLHVLDRRGALYGHQRVPVERLRRGRHVYEYDRKLLVRLRHGLLRRFRNLQRLPGSIELRGGDHLHERVELCLLAVRERLRGNAMSVLAPDDLLGPWDTGFRRCLYVRRRLFGRRVQPLPGRLILE